MNDVSCDDAVDCVFHSLVCACNAQRLAVLRSDLGDVLLADPDADELLERLALVWRSVAAPAAHGERQRDRRQRRHLPVQTA